MAMSPTPGLKHKGTCLPSPLLDSGTALGGKKELLIFVCSEFYLLWGQNWWLSSSYMPHWTLLYWNNKNHLQTKGINTLHTPLMFLFITPCQAASYACGFEDIIVLPKVTQCQFTAFFLSSSLSLSRLILNSDSENMKWSVSWKTEAV